MKFINPNKDYLFDYIEEHKWIKYTLYGGGLIIGIWVLGKASKLLSNAIINFKHLKHAIKD